MSVVHSLVRIFSGSSRKRRRRRNKPSWFNEDSHGMSDTFREFPNVHTTDAAVTCVTAVGSSQFASGSEDQGIALVNKSEGTITEKWLGHQNVVTKIAYSPSKKCVYSGSRDCTLRCWTRGTSAPIDTLPAHDLIVTGLTVSHDGSHFYSGSRDNSVKMWNCCSEGRQSQCMRYESISRNLVTHMQCSPVSNILVQTSEDRTIRIWDTVNLQVVASSPLLSTFQNYCDMASNGLHCLTCNNGTGPSSAHIWDIRNMSDRPVVEISGHTERITSCAFAGTFDPYGQVVATASDDGSIKVWSSKTGELLSALSLSGACPIRSMSITSSSDILLSGGDGCIYLLEIRPLASQLDLSLESRYGAPTL